MSFFTRSASGLFASESLLAHLLRGVVAVSLLAWAIANQTTQPMAALAAGAGALVAFRGCPLCWTIGLAETVAQRWRGIGPRKHRVDTSGASVYIVPKSESNSEIRNKRRRPDGPVPTAPQLRHPRLPGRLPDGGG